MRDIDRTSDADLAFLAMDRGPVPEQLAVVLVLDRPLPSADLARLLAGRVAAVPRLRQRLIRTPPGCGPPIWADDPDFDVRRHLGAADPPAPGETLTDTALPWVLRRLPRDRPLWRAVLADDGRAVVLVVHHALSDGLGGLAALGRLLDGALPPPPARPARSPVPDTRPAPTAGSRVFPAPVARPSRWRLVVDAGRARAAGARAFPGRPTRPSWRSLLVDAGRARVAGVRALPVRLRRLRTAMAAGGGLVAAPVAPCSLLRPTGGRRRAAVVRVPLAALRAAAHERGGGVNAALLVAVAGALRRLLAGRGETLGEVTVAVPVGVPRAAGGTTGNMVSPLLVTVPAGGDQLAQVAAEVRARRAAAAGPAPVAVLGGCFRLIAALGGYRWYMNRQRRLHTLVSHLRGPAEPVRLGGAAVREMIPLVVGGAGNITVSFVALSYLGTLTVTAVADPGRCPDLDVLATALAAELAALAGKPGAVRR